MGRWNLSETDYPAVRRVMGPERERLDDDELENVLERMFPGTDPVEVEDFMQTVQRFGKQAAPIVQKVGPGMAQGAMKGGMVAGPWGALAGAVGGGAASLLSGGPAAAPAAPAPGAALPGPAPSVPAGAPASAAAAAQLLALLSRPETMQALLALVMAQLGRSAVSLGQHQVPAEAFANAIAELAAEAAHGSTGSAHGGSGYWFDPHGEPRCDLANPTSCAALLWTDLAEAADSEEWEEESFDDD